MMIVHQAKFGKKSLIRHRSISCHLPDEVLIEILQRLPDAKSVIRCKLVCRKWYGIISTTSFIRGFSNHHRTTTSTAKISHFVPNCRQWQLDYFPRFLVRQEISNHVTVIASCNDLLLCRFSQTEYCICNPITRQYAKLPPAPKISTMEVASRVVVGFTINPEHSYRVVFIYVRRAMDGMVIHDFSSETNEWRDCIIVPSFQDAYTMILFIGGMQKMIFNKGMGFWLHNYLQICIYNPQNLTMRAISNPGGHTAAVIGVCQGFLRFFELISTGDVDEDGDEDGEVSLIAVVWELNDDEKWSVVHNVHLHQLGDLWHSGVEKAGMYVSLNLWALAIDPTDADIVYIRVGEDPNINIVSCNLKKMEMKHIQGRFDNESSDAPPIILQLFPLMAPVWPTPIRLAN